MRSDIETRVNKARDNIAAIRSEFAATESGLIPETEALAKLDQWLDRQTENLRAWQVPAWQFCNPTYEVSNVQSIGEHNGLGLLLQVMRPQVREHFASLIRAEYVLKATDGRSNAERIKAMDALQAKLFDAEIAEEKIIVEGERAGVYIPRRPDANPKVLVAVL